MSTTIEGYLVFVRKPDIDESTADVHYYGNAIGDTGRLPAAVSYLQLLGVDPDDIHYHYWQFVGQDSGMPDPLVDPLWPETDKALTYYGTTPDLEVANPGTTGYERPYGGGSQDGYLLFYWELSGAWSFLYACQELSELYQFVASKKQDGYDTSRMCLFWWEIAFVPGFGYPTPAPSDQLLWVGGGGLGTFEDECDKLPTGDSL